uniref:EAL domain-containing protein n=1 Tax=Pseudomonas sp. UBA6310 TaxID=1947327 RepID=UPI002580F0A1
AITRAIIAMAHSLELDVVAEGVEEQAQLDFLKAHGCDEIQGYLIARPLAVDAFVALLEEQRRD